MKKSKSLDNAKIIMSEFSQLFNGNYLGTFGSIFKMPVNPLDLGVLGKDLYLIDIDLKDPYDCKLHYGNLYKKVETGEAHVINGIELQFKKVSNDIFRVGGMCSGFKNNDYCALIYYNHISTKNNSCLGNHCVIDTKGKIAFKADSAIEYPYYKKGCIIKYRDYYINLKTGLPNVNSSYHQSIESENYLFVESSGYNNEFPKGVYKIEYNTGNFEVFN